MAIADLDIVISRLSEGIVDFGDGVFYAFQGLAYFPNGQWGRASISFGLARAGQSLPAPLTSTMLPLAALIGGDSDRTREALEEARRIRVHSPQRASVYVGDTVEVFALHLPWHPAEREQWLDRRTADFGSPDLSRRFIGRTHLVRGTFHRRGLGPAGPPRARMGARTVRANRFGPLGHPAARWLEARTEADTVFAETVEPLSRDGIPDMPIVEALIHLDLASVESGPSNTPPALEPSRPSPHSVVNEYSRRSLLTQRRRVGYCRLSRLARLTDREREIATLLLEGLSYAQIGKELFITRSTVSFHLTRIYAKTGTTSRHELAQATHNATRRPGRAPRPDQRFGVMSTSCHRVRVRHGGQRPASPSPAWTGSTMSAAPAPGNSGSSDGFSDGFEGVGRSACWGNRPSAEAAAVVRAVRGVEIGGLMATVAAALPGSLTAAPAPELVASWSRGSGCLPTGWSSTRSPSGGAAAELSQHGHGRSRGLRCPEMAGAFLRWCSLTSPTSATSSSRWPAVASAKLLFRAPSGPL